MPADGPWIGRARSRVEDERLTIGHGRFVSDLTPQDCLHLAFARSPYAHAMLTEVGIEDAAAVPGVAAVITGDDVAGLDDLPVNPLLPGIRQPRFPVLARDRLRAVGEPVAAVIAYTLATAVDAAELVEIDCDPLDPALGTEEGGPDLFEDVPANRAFAHRWHAGDGDDVFAAAHSTVSVQVDHERVAPFALEPRAALAEPADDGALTVWLSTQTPHRARDDLAALLGLEATKVRVVAPDVGGAFGGKASLYPEELMVAWAAQQLGRPVKWVASRGEELLAATHGRGLATRAVAALAEDGRVVALRAQIAAPLGHWMPFSAVVPARNAGRILPGPYAISAVDIEAHGTLTSTAPMGIYRGAGRPEAAALMERLMDAGAVAVDLDPVEIRRRNLIPASAMPYSTPTGETYDSGDYVACLDRACAAAGYDALRRDQAARRARGELVGIGVAVYVEPCGTGWEGAEIRLAADGTIVAATGSSAQGQGRETTVQAIVADGLGVPPEIVRVAEGDTLEVPAGIGALASRSTAIGGSAVVEAAENFRAKAVGAAATLLQAKHEDIELTAAGPRDAAGGAEIAWAALAEAAGALAAEIRYTVPGEAWAYGACIAVLSVDPETGVPTVEGITWADDAGVVVNPLLADGQLVGGLAQGLGQALMERIVYDDDGQLVTGSLMDYAVPRAADMPPVDLHRSETPATVNRLGAKGVGEAGCIGIPAAILNAAYDALAPIGVRELRMPLTPARLWDAMRRAGEDGSR